MGSKGNGGGKGGAQGDARGSGKGGGGGSGGKGAGQGARGGSGGKTGQAPYGKATLDNRSRQLNVENDAYHQSRGLPGRPAP